MTSADPGSRQRLDQALDRWGDRWLARRSTVPRRLFLGFSGGVDSTVLLHAALRWARIQGVALTAVHLDHGVASDSGHWAHSCEVLCRRWAVSYRTVSASQLGYRLVPGAGFEAEARAFRYHVFERCLEQSGDSMLLAHHGDDQAETILLRMLQGRGVVPMPPWRPLGAGTIERPLLGLGRAELERYAALEGLAVLEDPANRQLDYDRNFLRHRVLSALQERWPGVVGQLNRAAVTADAAFQALVEQLRGVSALDVTELVALEPPVALATLRAWLQGRGEFEATDRALLAFLAQLASAGDREPTLRCAWGALSRRRGQVVFAPLSH